MLKSDNRLKGDHATHLWGSIEIPIALSSIWKCLYAYDIIKGGLMMWVSFVMDENIQEGKWMVVERKTLKWAIVNSALPTRSP